MRRLRVKEVAQARGFTIARLERAAGIDIKTVRAIWHNPRHNASFDTLEKIAAAVGVPVTSLIEDDNPLVQAGATTSINDLNAIAEHLRELDRLLRRGKSRRPSRVRESSPTLAKKETAEVEKIKNQLQALLPSGLKVVYVPEYRANGIFVADTSTPANLDINYPIS